MLQTALPAGPSGVGRRRPGRLAATARRLSGRPAPARRRSAVRGLLLAGAVGLVGLWGLAGCAAGPAATTAGQSATATGPSPAGPAASGQPTAAGAASGDQTTGVVGERPAPGLYNVAVSLTGGSGRASVQSPARLTVTAEAMTAEIVWSSPYYTYMEVDGVTYQPTNQLGENASFTIPVALDQDLAVSAETTAMSQPHVIDYQLRLDSTTLVAAP